MRFAFLRTRLNYYFNRIKNEKIRRMILQALPFWVASLLTGLVAVAYTRLFLLAEKGASYVFHLSPWYLFIVTPVCFLAAYFMVQKIAPYAGGSGIPQVMAAIEISGPRSNAVVDLLLNIKTIVIKIFSSSIMALGGGIVGREGPTIQVAAAIFRKINMLLPAWWPKISKRNMIMTGAAAGLAAAFNTPLGGIVFAMEELTKTHISFYKTAIFSAVIIAGLTAQGLLGPYLYLGYPQVNDFSFLIFPVVLLVAIICGLGAAIMCKFMQKISRWRASFGNSWKTVLFILGCALVVASIGYFTGMRHLNSGKELITEILFTSDKYVAWYTPVLRMFGSVASFTSGAAGGVFAPALSSGASIGSLIAGWLHFSPIESNILILAGMTAFLTGITRSPFTSAILVLEMTDGHHIIFHLMLAAMVANMAAYFIDKRSLYEHLKHQYIKELGT